MSLSHFPDHVLGLLLVLLAPVAVLAASAPAVLRRWLGGRRRQNAPIPEAFLRVAGILLLIGAVITWYRLWKS